MSEAADKARIRLALGREARLFTNPVGNGWMGKQVSRPVPGCVILAAPRRIAFGLHPGSSDLIGWRAVTVTPEMVGREVAVFSALEIKADGGRHPVSEEQRKFLAAVIAAGGYAGVARTEADARLILGLGGLLS